MCVCARACTCFLMPSLVEQLHLLILMCGWKIYHVIWRMFFSLIFINAFPYLFLKYIYIYMCVCVCVCVCVRPHARTCVLGSKDLGLNV